MNRLEELEMKWDVTRMVLLLPILIFSMFGILTLVLFMPQVARLNDDCSTYDQGWKIDTCNEVKQSAFKTPILMFSGAIGMFAFKEIMKRTYYKELFRR